MINSRTSSATVGGSIANADVSDEKQMHGAEFREGDFARAVQRGVGEFFEKGVRLAVENAISLLNGGLAERLG